jgi:hypothetical protein
MIGVRAATTSPPGLAAAWLLGNVLAGAAIAAVAERADPGVAILSAGLIAGGVQVVVLGPRLPRPRGWLIATSLVGPLAWLVAAAAFALGNLGIAAAAVALARSGAGPTLSAGMIDVLAASALVAAGGAAGAVLGMAQARALPVGSPDRARWVLASALAGAAIALPGMRVLSWGTSDPSLLGVVLTRPVGGVAAGLGYALITGATLLPRRPEESRVEGADL